MLCGFQVDFVSNKIESMAQNINFVLVFILFQLVNIQNYNNCQYPCTWLLFVQGYWIFDLSFTSEAVGHCALIKHEKSFGCLKLMKNSILTNTWNSKRRVDFCFNLTIDRFITNWYYSNRFICDCSGHLSCLMITLTILKWIIDTMSAY